MIEYVKHIILPYVKRVRDSFEEDTPALVIMDNFKGQITPSMTEFFGIKQHPHLSPSTQCDRPTSTY